MRSRPKIGTSGELQFVVEQKHVIDFATDGMPAVLSTPNLIGFLEKTARETMQPFLEAGERSVGLEIELRHLAPTPLGATVLCSARIIHADGGQVTFQIDARDGHEIIARGVHKTAAVPIASFARSVPQRHLLGTVATGYCPASGRTA